MTSRRRLLLGATGLAAVGLTGCSGPATVPLPGAPTERPSSRSPSPSTPADPRAVAASRLLAALLTRSAGVSARSDLGSAPKALLQAVRDGHAQHLAALRAPEPTSRPLPSGTPTGTRSTGSLAAALSALATAERDAARTLRTSAAAAAGFASLLYASVGAACASYSTALGDDDPATPGEVAATTRPVLAPWSELDGLQDALAAAHALVYGYQAALGFVSETSGFGKELTARVLHFQQLRDRLTALVVAAQVQPVAAEPAYRLPVRVTGTSTATRLVRRLEVAAQPHFGRFVAASTTPAVHTLALGELAGAVSTGLQRGAGVTAWPGWPS